MIEQRVPRQVVIEVSAKCNLRCVGCPLCTDKGGGYMSFPFFKSVVDRITFPTTVVPWLNGEPLMNPDYGRMVDYLIQKKLRFYTTTNGHFWRDDFFQRVTEEDSTCYQVLFSLDGLPDLRSRSIELARPGSVRRWVLEHIERFLELKQKKNAKLDVAVKMCERGQDYEEFENYVSFWLSKGVDFVVVGRLLDNDHVKEGFRLYPCRYFDDMAMEIRWDGRVVPCSYNEMVMNEGALSMGKLDETTPLLDFYNNSSYTALRVNHHAGVFPHPCNTCGFAYCGDGWVGQLQFRNPKLRIGDRPVYFHCDYYNSLYSLVEKKKGISWGNT